MKHYLFLGAAAIAMLGSFPAHAQQYGTGAKSDDSLLRGAQRMDTRPDPGSYYREPVRQSDSNIFSRIEPAAGNARRDGRFSGFTGFYGGGDVGYSIGSFDVDAVAANPGGDVAVDGLSGGLFAGYGFEHTFNWLGGYAGIEAGWEWSDADGDLGATTYEKNDKWHLTFRPGLSMHQDALGYGIIGYSMTEFESEGDDEDIEGLMLGAGAEFNTKTPFKTRIEYVYTNYKDENLNNTGFDGHENNIKLGILFRM